MATLNDWLNQKAVQETFVIWHKKNGEDWQEWGRFSNEAEAVLLLRAVEKTFPFDRVVIDTEFE